MAGVRDILINHEDGKVAQGFALAQAKSADNPEVALGGAAAGAAGIGAAIGGGARKAVDAGKALLDGAKGAFNAPAAPAPEPVPAAPSPAGANAAGPKPYIAPEPSVASTAPRAAPVRAQSWTSPVNPTQPMPAQPQAWTSPVEGVRAPAAPAPSVPPAGAPLAQPQVAQELAALNGSPEARITPNQAKAVAQSSDPMARFMRPEAAPAQPAAGPDPYAAEVRARAAASRKAAPTQMGGGGAGGGAGEAAGKGARGLFSRTGAAVAGKALAATAGVPDQLQHGATNMDDTIALELGSPSEGKAGSLYRGVAGNAISLARRTGNALSAIPFTSIEGKFGDKIIGGLRDVFKGQMLGDTKFEESQAAAPVPSKVNDDRRQADDGTNGGITPLRSAPVNVSQYDAPLDGARVYGPGNAPTNLRGVQPDQVPNGGGFIQGPGGKVVPLGTARADYKGTPPVVRQAADGGARAQDVLPSGPNRYTGGFMQALVDAKAAQAREHGAVTQAELGIKASTADLARRKYIAERGDVNRKGIESLLASQAESEVPSDFGAGFATSKEGAAAKRADEVKTRGAKLRADVERSVANRGDGETIESLGPTHVQQLLLARKLRDKAEAARSGWSQQARDFFGASRADSGDLYSYMPHSVERATLPFGGGYIIRSKNGNTMNIKAAQGGGFNWTGPNDPIDADIAELIAPKIAEFERNEKAKKGAR